MILGLFHDKNTDQVMRYVLMGLLCLLPSFLWARQKTPVPDVAPAAQGWHVVINVPQQRLFLYQNGQLHKVYPVAVGKNETQTDLGEHTIGAKSFNPTWHIPRSIQQKRGDGVKTVPPGPDNPLGPVFVRLGDPKLGLGIHGTNNPASVPGVRSHGCVRMKSPDALEFARKITTGSPATVSYEMAALNVDAAGHLWLAVFGDPYRKKNLPINKLKQSINAWSKTSGQTVNNQTVNQVLKTRSGRAVCLTCKGKNPRIQGALRSLAWNSGSASFTQAKTEKPLPETKSVAEEKEAVLVNTGEIEQEKTMNFQPSIQPASVFE